MIRHPLFSADSAGASVMKALSLEVPAPRTLRSEVSRDVDALVMKALERAVERRFDTASERALAIERSSRAPASPTRISQWMCAYAADRIAARNAAVAALEDASTVRPSQRRLTKGEAFVPTTTAITVNAGTSASASASPSADAALPSASARRAASRARVVVSSLVAVALVATAFGVREARKARASVVTDARREQPELTASTPAVSPTAAPPASSARASVEDAPLSATSPPPSSVSPATRPPAAPRRVAAPTHAPPRAAPTAGGDDAYGLSH